MTSVASTTDSSVTTTEHFNVKSGLQGMGIAVAQIGIGAALTAGGAGLITLAPYVTENISGKGVIPAFFFGGIMAAAWITGGPLSVGGGLRNIFRGAQEIALSHTDEPKPSNWYGDGFEGFISDIKNIGKFSLKDTVKDFVQHKMGMRLG